MSADSRPHGERLFARYAYHPNEKGYCGPDGAPLLAEVARGEGAGVDVRGAATRFSGAWPYLTVIGSLLACDPLDERAVRAYWTGSVEGDAIDPAVFWRELLAIIGPRAGSYWAYLDESLAAEAAPHHAFHVFGVYPWTRLLSTGRPEPVEVLESCAILPATVVHTDATHWRVRGPRLVYREGVLALDDSDDADAERDVAVPFGDTATAGEKVAIHWGAVAEVLDGDTAGGLEARVSAQLARVNARLAAS